MDLDDNLKFVETLGSGAYGEVFEVAKEIDDQEQRFAIKAIEKSKIREKCITEGQNLTQLINEIDSDLTEKEIKLIGIQIFLGIHKMTLLNIAHRDIKPDNIILLRKYDCDFSQNLDICLADFGFAVELSTLPEGKQVILGTPGYLAPEILFCQKCQQNSDVFSAAAILYYLSTKKHIFYGKTVEDVLINNAKYS
eukprot:403344392